MAYANVAIAPPRLRFVLDKYLIQELTDTLCDTVCEALDDYLRSGRQSVTPLTPSLAPTEPLSTPLPPKELLSPCSPPLLRSLRSGYIYGTIWELS